MKKRLLPFTLLAVIAMIATGCGGDTSSSAPASSSETPTTSSAEPISSSEAPSSSSEAPSSSSEAPITYSISITNKEALQAAWYVIDGNRDLALSTVPVGVIKDLIKSGEITITSSNADVISVNNANLIPHKKGTATITVGFHDKTDSVDLEILDEEHPYVATPIKTAVEDALAKNGATTEPYDLVGVVTQITGNNGFYLVEDGAGFYCYKTFPDNIGDYKNLKVGDTVHWHGCLYSYNGLVEPKYSSTDEKLAQTCRKLNKEPVTPTVTELTNFDSLEKTQAGVLFTAKGLSGDGFTSHGGYLINKTRAVSMFGEDVKVVLNYHANERESKESLAALDEKLNQIESGPYTFDVVGAALTVNNNAFQFEVNNPNQIELHEIASADIVKPTKITLTGTDEMETNSSQLVKVELEGPEGARPNYRGLVWSSSDETIATVDEIGTVTTLSKTGTAKITAKSMADETVFAELNISVAPIDTTHTKLTGASLLKYDGSGNISYNTTEAQKIVNGDSFSYYGMGAYTSENGALRFRKSGTGQDNPSYLYTGELKAPVTSVSVTYNAAKHGTYKNFDMIKVTFGKTAAFAEGETEVHNIHFDYLEHTFVVSPSDLTAYKFVKLDYTGSVTCYMDEIDIRYDGTEPYVYPYSATGADKDNAFTLKDARAFVTYNAMKEPSATPYFVKGSVSAIDTEKSTLTLADGEGRTLGVAGYKLAEGVTGMVVGDEVVVKGHLAFDSDPLMKTVKVSEVDVRPEVVEITHPVCTITVDPSIEHATVKELSATSGLNGSTFTFKVEVEEGYKVMAVNVNDVAVTPVNDVYTGTIAGNTVIKVTTGPNVATELKFDFTTKSASQSSYKSKWNYGDLEIYGGANNNAGWTCVKMGPKSADLATLTEAPYMKTNNAISSAVSSVELVVDPTVAACYNKAEEKISIQVLVYSDATCETKIGESAAQESPALDKGANPQTLTFVPTSGDSWAAGSYYKVVFTCTNTTTYNGIACFASLTFKFAK